MSTDEKKTEDSAEEKPKVKRPSFKSGAPKPPEKPKAPTEENIKDEEEMPDLSTYHFMEW